VKRSIVPSGLSAGISRICCGEDFLGNVIAPVVVQRAVAPVYRGDLRVLAAPIVGAAMVDMTAAAVSVAASVATIFAVSHAGRPRPRMANTRHSHLSNLLSSLGANNNAISEGSRSRSMMLANCRSASESPV
jgi:hypothetical protein